MANEDVDGGDFFSTACGNSIQPISTPAPHLGPPGVIGDLAPSIVDNVLGNTHTLKLRGLVDLTNSSVECYCGRSFRLVFCPRMPKLNQKDIIKKVFPYIYKPIKKNAPSICYDLLWNLQKKTHLATSWTWI